MISFISGAVVGILGTLFIVSLAVHWATGALSIAGHSENVSSENAQND